ESAPPGRLLGHRPISQKKPTMAKSMELTCTYSCCEDGMVAMLFDGYTDSPDQMTVRDVIKMARDRETATESREMLREVLGLLAGKIAQRAQDTKSDAERVVYQQHLQEMFR